jgi:hypothetical protein
MGAEGVTWSVHLHFSIFTSLMGGQIFNQGFGVGSCGTGYNKLA